MLLLHRVLNKMLHLRYSAGFWICSDFRIYQSCEYTRVLNMSGLHKVLNKCFMIVVWQYYGYNLDSEYARVLNMLGLHIFLNKILDNRYLTGFWICLEFWLCQCYIGFCRKRPIIHVWQIFQYSSGSYYAKAWIYRGCEYAKVTQGSV